MKWSMTHKSTAAELKPRRLKQHEADKTNSDAVLGKPYRRSDLQHRLSEVFAEA
jgi:hypothetical protein